VQKAVFRNPHKPKIVLWCFWTARRRKCSCCCHITRL